MLINEHSKKLLKKYADLLESGTPIKDQETKNVLVQVLENTRNYYKMKGMVNEAGIAQADVVGAKGNGVLRGGDSWAYTGTEKGDYYLPNIVLPMLRRIMPDLIANELVGVQPMNGPVGYAIAYRPTYGANGGMVHDNQLTGEIGFNPTRTDFTGVSADGEAGDFWKAYAGEDTRFAGKGADLSAAEYLKLDDNYPTVSFGLVKSAVEAKTRKLAAHWSPELAEDMQAMHGIDVEKQMVETITFEVGAEIDRQIVTEMVRAAITGGSTSVWSPISADGLDQMGRLATLLTQITIEANQIALRTKRGNANFVITTPRVCAMLEQLGMNKFTSLKANGSVPSVPDTGVGALSKIGYINNDQQLLVRDSFVQGEQSDYLVMGYKGKNAADSGIIFLPYVPLSLSKVIQPGTFTPSIGARTRYGIMNNPWDAKNFYTFMKIDTFVPGGYVWNSNRNFIAEPTKVNRYVGNPVVVGK